MQHHRYTLTTCLIAVMFLSCSLIRPEKEDNATDKNPSGGEILTTELIGYGIDGEERTCTEVTCSPDTTVASPPVTFTEQCVSEGKIVKTCACGDYICVEESDVQTKRSNKGLPGEFEFTGYDMEGDHVSCSHSGREIACTMIYGPPQEFKDRCEALGHKSYECDCHDYLCSAKIDD